MASNGERRLNEEASRLGLLRDGEEIEEEEATAGGVAGLVGRCEGLTLVGGIEGGGFKSPGLMEGGGGTADRATGGRAGSAGGCSVVQEAEIGAVLGLVNWCEGGGGFVKTQKIVVCGGVVLVPLEVVVVRGGGVLVWCVGAASSGGDLFPRLVADGVGGSNWGCGWSGGGGAFWVIIGDVGWKNRRRVGPGMMVAEGGGEGSVGPPGPID